MNLDPFRARHDMMVETTERAVANALASVAKARLVTHAARLAVKRAESLMKTFHGDESGRGRD